MEICYQEELFLKLKLSSSHVGGWIRLRSAPPSRPPQVPAAAPAPRDALALLGAEAEPSRAEPGHLHLCRLLIFWLLLPAFLPRTHPPPPRSARPQSQTRPPRLALFPN